MMSNESGPGDTMMVIVTSVVYDNVTTSDNTSLSEADMHVSEAVFFVLLTAVCIGMTIIGNLLVVLSVFTYRPLKVSHINLSLSFMITVFGRKFQCYVPLFQTSLFTF